MKLRTFDLGWIGALILLLMLFKAIDLASGWTAESPTYPTSQPTAAAR